MSQAYFKCFLITLLLTTSVCPTYAQKPDDKYEKYETELITGTNSKLLTQLQTETVQAMKSGNVQSLSKYYSLIGDYYLNIGDIESALKNWNLAGNFLEKKYGSNSIFQAVKYYNLSRYYGYLIKTDSALYFANKAMVICRTRKDSVNLHRLDKIYKQYGYVLKIKAIQNNSVLKGTAIARQYYDSAIYFNEKLNYNKAFRINLILDIGNTFTDEIVYYQRLNQIKNASRCQKQANVYAGGWFAKAICSVYFKRDKNLP